MKNPYENEDFLYGLKVGKEHQQPSPETTRRFDSIEGTIRDLGVTVANMSNSIALLPEIKRQVIYTNGRVMGNTAWRWYTAGGLAIVAILVVPVLFWAVYELVNIDDRIQSSVHSALQAYDIIYE